MSTTRIGLKPAPGTCHTHVARANRAAPPRSQNVSKCDLQITASGMSHTTTKVPRISGSRRVRTINDHSDRPGTSLLGVRIWVDGLDSLVAASQAAFEGRESSRRPYIFACANPHSLTIANRDPAFK